MLWVSFVLFDCRPLCSIAVAVEAGEDHRALVQRGDKRKQFGHRRDAADQSRGDHRMARRRAAPSRGLLFQQAIAPRCRVESLFLGENPRPMVRQDLKKLVDDAPMLRQPLRNQIDNPREACSLGRDPIEKPGEARRERRGLSGQERLLAAPFAPLQDEPGQQQTPAQLGDRRWHRQVLRAAAGQRQLVRIEIADGPHPRQQQRDPRYFSLRRDTQECVSQ